MNRRSIEVAMVFVVLVAMAIPATAQGDSGWSLRAEGVWVNPDVSYTEIDDEGDRATATANDAFGYGIGAEYRFSRWLGVDFAYQSASPELEVRLVSGQVPELSLTASDKISFRPFTVALDLHLTPDRAVDLVIAPVIAWVGYGNLRLTANYEGESIEVTRLQIGDDWAIGGRLAADFAIAEGPWSIRASALYLQTELDVKDETGEHQTLDFDPMVIAAGVSYRF